MGLHAGRDVDSGIFICLIDIKPLFDFEPPYRVSVSPW